MKPTKPILGFGPIGYALLAVALVLLWVLLSGYDLRYQIYRLITATLGWSWVRQFNIWYIFANYFALLTPRFGLISLSYVLIALHLYPNRISWWWYLLLVFCAQVTGGWYLWSSGIWGPFPLQLGSQLGQRIAAELAIGMVTSVVFWRISRSWFVAWASALVILWSVGWDAVGWLVPSTQSYDNWLMYSSIGACVYHCLMAYILLRWSILARLRSRREDICQSCGYDLAGLPGNTCPECGSAIDSSPVASSGNKNEHNQSTTSTPRSETDKPASG